MEQDPFTPWIVAYASTVRQHEFTDRTAREQGSPRGLGFHAPPRFRRAWIRSVIAPSCDGGWERNFVRVVYCYCTSLRTDRLEGGFPREGRGLFEGSAADAHTAKAPP